MHWPTALMIICTMEFDFWNVWELCGENLLGLCEHNVTTCTFADTSKNHDMVKFVEFTILCQTITKIHTNSFIDQASTRLFCWILHCRLDQLQALSMPLMLDGAHLWVWIHLVLWSLNSASCCQLGCSTLAQIHMRNSRVVLLGPWITWSHGIQVQSDVTELVNPTHQIAISICIASPC